MADADFAARFRHMLVVEDGAILAMEVEMSLEELGIARVSLAATPQQALDILQLGSVDGALLDVMLGEEDSRGVAEVLAARGIPFAIMSGFGDASDLAAAYPAAPVLTKPFSRPDLVAALQRLG